MTAGQAIRRGRPRRGGAFPGRGDMELYGLWPGSPSRAARAPRSRKRSRRLLRPTSCPSCLSASSGRCVILALGARAYGRAAWGCSLLVASARAPVPPSTHFLASLIQSFQTTHPRNSLPPCRAGGADPQLDSRHKFPESAHVPGCHRVPACLRHPGWDPGARARRQGRQRAGREAQPRARGRHGAPAAPRPLATGAALRRVAAESGGRAPHRDPRRICRWSWTTWRTRFLATR